jgi:hypothetical protein
LGFPPCGTQPRRTNGTLCSNVTINSTHLEVGTAVNAACANTGALCLNSQDCVTPPNFTNPSCCYGICAFVGVTGCSPSSNFICSTQYGCNRTGQSCPTGTTGLCAPVSGISVTCSNVNGHPNFGCCSGRCGAGGNCM